MKNTTRFSSPYNPLYFLASLGNGGLAVSFFMYLMFMLPHPVSPIPTFTTLAGVFAAGNPVTMALVSVAVVGILYFAFQHYRLLLRNLAAYKAFQQTPAYEKLMSGNAEVTRMAIPLTLAMSINVAFILGALFVPGLWGVVEYLFPAAIVAFGAVAVLALRMFASYAGRILTNGQFEWSANNSLSQLVAVFAMSMIGVGFAAPAAMSHVPTTVVVGMVLSIFFLTSAAIWGLIMVVLGFKDMLEHGVSEEGSPSLWIIIPIVTVSGIATVRLSHGLHHVFNGGPVPSDMLVNMAIMLSVQLLFGLIGFVTMRKLHYFADYIHGEKASAASYALICPGVALMVFGMFFLHPGLVANGIVDKFSIAYFILVAPLVYLQFVTIKTMVLLNRKHLGGSGAAQANPSRGMPSMDAAE
ncbi:TsoY family (seleno)protein [Hoeflea prorocentri]|uniref:Uncharacterized protein n=1 Tax=Hoeflea prorocentri TaxID=1922333 RepID=A0A9X3UKR5_9HYPH|nr:hypothetical protein [Hoeflea prorocentri]MCY6380721.1 hypothetical protein [Hoeflea prorocentri]MDA5398521.1 hypothetical protein [Hoeflea prorocentri]